MPEVDRAVRTRRRSLAELAVRGPAGFREILQRLGPTFIKLGQFLALRPDIVPQEYCDELMRLLDQVPPFSWQQAKSILAEHFGKDPSQVFEFINPRPTAAGSVAQVHFARLVNGDEVAVKIQRPDVERHVRRDLKRVALVAWLMEVGQVSLIASPKELHEELAAWMLQEIDLTHELSNLTRLYDLAAGSSSQKIPRPYPKLSGPKVLVAEFLRGIPISEILVSMRSGQQRDLDRIAELGVDWDRFAENLTRATLSQIFRYHFFHADLHPGNLFVLPGDVVGYVDFSLCDKVDDTIRKQQMRYLRAVYNNDTEQMFKAMTEVLIPGPKSDVERFRMEFMAEAKRWTSELDDHEDRSREERSPIAQWMIGVMRAARRNGYQVPASILSMYRALLTAETVATSVATRADLQQVGREFFESLAWEDLAQTLRQENLLNLGLIALSLLTNAPAQLQQILTDVTENRFRLNTDVSEDPRTERARNRRTALLATSVVTVSLAIIISNPRLPEPFGIPLAWPLYVVLAVLYVAIAIQWKRLR
jgi:ubiquinone biosynthesis protein